MVDDAINERVGAAIRFQREAKLRLTQEELGKRLGISRPSVANIERGRQQLSVSQLVRFAHVLGVMPEELLPRIEAAGPQLPASSQLAPSTDQGVVDWADRILLGNG